MILNLFEFDVLLVARFGKDSVADLFFGRSFEGEGLGVGELLFDFVSGLLDVVKIAELATFGVLLESRGLL